MAESPVSNSLQSWYGRNLNVMTDELRRVLYKIVSANLTLQTLQQFSDTAHSILDTAAG